MRPTPLLGTAALLWSLLWALLPLLAVQSTVSSRMDPPALLAAYLPSHLWPSTCLRLAAECMAPALPSGQLLHAQQRRWAEASRLPRGRVGRGLCSVRAQAAGGKARGAHRGPQLQPH